MSEKKSIIEKLDKGNTKSGVETCEDCSYYKKTVYPDNFGYSIVCYFEVKVVDIAGRFTKSCRNFKSSPSDRIPSKEIKEIL